jgi:selenide,water dikinase
MLLVYSHNYPIILLISHVGVYTRDDCHVDLLKLCSFAKCRFITDEVSGIDPVLKTVSFSSGRPQLSFDVASINIGITPKMDFSLSELHSQIHSHSHITMVKPINGFARRWEEIMNRVISSDNTSEIIQVVVVGGGAGGCELCLSMCNRLKNELTKAEKLVDKVQFTLVNRSSTVMQSHNRYDVYF